MLIEVKECTTTETLAREYENLPVDIQRALTAVLNATGDDDRERLRIRLMGLANFRVKPAVIRQILADREAV
jgi:hypothetical protein